MKHPHAYKVLHISIGFTKGTKGMITHRESKSGMKEIGPDHHNSIKAPRLDKWLHVRGIITSRVLLIMTNYRGIHLNGPLSLFIRTME